MKKNLIGLWHFDENNRHVANNALENHPPLLLHGAGRTNRRLARLWNYDSQAIAQQAKVWVDFFVGVFVFGRKSMADAAKSI